MLPFRWQSIRFLLPLGIALSVAATPGKRDCGPNTATTYTGEIRAYDSYMAGSDLGHLDKPSGVGGIIRANEDNEISNAEPRGTYTFTSCDPSYGFDLICSVSPHITLHSCTLPH